MGSSSGRPAYRRTGGAGADVTTFGKARYLRRAMGWSRGFVVKAPPPRSWQTLYDGCTTDCGWSTRHWPRKLWWRSESVDRARVDVLKSARTGGTVADIARELHLSRARSVTTCPPRSAKPAPGPGRGRPHRYQPRLALPIASEELRRTLRHSARFFGRNNCRRVGGELGWRRRGLHDRGKFSTKSRLADTGEGITADELQLAARNHGMPLEALRYDLTPPAALHPGSLRHPGGECPRHGGSPLMVRGATAVVRADALRAMGRQTVRSPRVCGQRTGRLQPGRSASRG